jgi:hypothetical protein
VILGREAIEFAVLCHERASGRYLGENEVMPAQESAGGTEAVPLPTGSPAVQRCEPVVGSQERFGQGLAEILHCRMLAELPHGVLQQRDDPSCDFRAARQGIDRVEDDREGSSLDCTISDRVLERDVR